MKGTTIWAMRFLLLAMAAIPYASIYENDFIDYDDEILIVNNPSVSAGLSEEGIRWSWTNRMAPYWMPIVWVSFQLDASLSGEGHTQIPGGSHLSPLPFHIQNVFWHICNVQLLFALFRRTTGSPGRSFAVAALFSVHPMHVESVAWAIERKDVLMCFFGLVSLLAYVRFTENRSWIAYAAMLLSFEASLMCKPMLITMPFLLLLIDYWPLRRLNLPSPAALLESDLAVPQPTPFSLLVEKLPVFAVALVMAVQTMNSRAIFPMQDVSTFSRAMNALTGYEFYLYKTIYPVDLSIFYPHSGNNWSLLHSLVGGALLALGTAVSLWKARSWRWLPVGWFWFVGTLVPVIGLTQGGQQAWADRFCYWPHIGVFLALVWGVAELSNRLRIASWLVGSLLAMALSIAMLLSWIQVGYWRSSTTVWEHAIAATEENDFAHQHLSMSYRREGRIDAAEAHLQESARIQREKIRRSLK